LGRKLQALGEAGQEKAVIPAISAGSLALAREAFKTAPGVNDMLARAASDRFFIPQYVGARGWLSLWLDLPQVDLDSD